MGHFPFRADDYCPIHSQAIYWDGVVTVLNQRGQQRYIDFRGQCYWVLAYILTPVENRFPKDSE